jgi:hypothetical protein
VKECGARPQRTGHGSARLRGKCIRLPAAVLYSYLNPAINFVKTYRATTAEKAQQHELQAVNTRLHRRIQRANDPIVLDQKARAQGMIAPGETAFVVRGLPH